MSNSDDLGDTGQGGPSFDFSRLTFDGRSVAEFAEDLTGRTPEDEAQEALALEGFDFLSSTHAALMGAQFLGSGLSAQDFGGRPKLVLPIQQLGVDQPPFDLTQARLLSLLGDDALSDVRRLSNIMISYRGRHFNSSSMLWSGAATAAQLRAQVPRVINHIDEDQVEYGVEIADAVVDSFNRNAADLLRTDVLCYTVAYLRAGLVGREMAQILEAADHGHDYLGYLARHLSLMASYEPNVVAASWDRSFEGLYGTARDKISDPRNIQSTDIALDNVLEGLWEQLADFTDAKGQIVDVKLVGDEDPNPIRTFEGDFPDIAAALGIEWQSLAYDFDVNRMIRGFNERLKFGGLSASQREQTKGYRYEGGARRGPNRIAKTLSVREPEAPWMRF